MKKLLALVLALLMALSLVACGEQTPTGEYAGKTIVLHTNDVHGNIAYYAYIAGLKDQYAAEGAEVILADAGDFSQGTVYVSSSKGADAVTMLNAAGYDVLTLGNHEFDYGWAQAKENLAAFNGKVVCANVLENGAPIYDGHTIIKKGRVKIGFFGLDTPEAQTKANPALIQGLTFLAGEELYACAQAQADALKKEGADIVICLAHLGMDESSAPNRSTDLLANTTGIDFIIDGHSHTMAVATAETPIQSTESNLAYIGMVTIDNKTKAIEGYDLLPTPVEVKEGEEAPVIEMPTNAAVAAAAQEIMDRIDAEYGTVFAKSEVTLNGEKAPNGNRDSETNNGDIITDSMLWALTEQQPGSIEGVEAANIVAITNGGGIRAAINPGDITKKDVKTVLPFGNTLAVVYVKGSVLLEALEASTFCTPESVGAFPQTAGMEWTLNTKAAFDQGEAYPDSTYFAPKSINRVSIQSVNGKAFDENAEYAVITNNFLAAGGDTYYAFAASSGYDTGLAMDEVLMAYITEKLGGTIGADYAEPQGRMTLK